MAERAYRSKYTGQQLEDLLDYASGLEGTIEGLKENDDFLNSSIEDLRYNDEKFENELFGKSDFLFVDLDLPSGNLWATKNLGSKSIGDAGLYFQWAMTKGYRPEDSYDFTFKNYDYYVDGKFVKYTPEDRLKYLSLDDDASRVTYKVDYYEMPTKQDISELVENTIQSQLFFKNKFVGIKFTSKKNPNTSIIIPASGYMYGTELKNIENYLSIWSCEIRETDDSYFSAYALTNDDKGYLQRIFGLPIRAIVNRDNIEKLPKGKITDIQEKVNNNTDIIKEIEEKITTIEKDININIAGDDVIDKIREMFDL